MITLKASGNLKILIVIFFCLSAFDFQWDKSKLLIRDWILVNIYSPRIEKNFKQSGMSAERREQVMKDWVEGSFLNIKPDGTYEVSILGSERETMFWQLSPNDTTLFVRKYRTDAPKEIEIEILTKKDLVIVLPDLNGEFTRMYFKAKEELEASDGSN